MKRLTIRTALALAALVLPAVTLAAGMQTQVDNLYLDMENYTAPGSFETARRSGYFAGRYTYKDEIVKENLFSVQMPSARGGCGGIDIFGGSFSFVNSDQIIALMEAVAANAKGYAFQLALDQICAPCMEIMNDLQTKIQALNEHMSSSCQLAQGVVNSVWNLGPFERKFNEDQTLKGMIEGVGTDFAELAYSIGDAATAVTRRKDAAPDAFELDTGAVVYKALKKHAVKNWFANGDDELIEEIMSMTGSPVIYDLQPDAAGVGDSAPKNFLAGDKFKLQDMVEGRERVDVYDCDADAETPNCRITETDTREINLVGLAEKLRDALIGDDGLVTQIRDRNLDADMSEANKSILAAMPHSVGSKIFTLAPVSPEAAETIVRTFSQTIALEMVTTLVRESLRSARVAVENYDDDNLKAQAIRQINDAEQRVDQQYHQLTQAYPPMRELEGYYADLMKNIRTPQYVDTGGATGATEAR